MKRSTKMLMMASNGRAENRGGSSERSENEMRNEMNRAENRRVFIDYEDYPRNESTTNRGREENEMWGNYQARNANDNYRMDNRGRRSAQNNVYGNMYDAESNYTHNARNNYRRAEDRFRDNDGRERYDDGRFAPDNNMNETYAPPGPYGESNGSGSFNKMNMIGFERENEPSYHMDGGQSDNVVDFSGGSIGAKHLKFTPELAKKWVENMENEDGTKGAHWNLEQVKQIMAQRGIDEDPYTFWAILNSIYSDDVKIAKKFNVNNIDYYVDRACAWLKDKDAVKEKAAAYFEYVVKH